MKNKLFFISSIFLFLHICSAYAFLSRIRFENGKELNFNPTDSAWYYADAKSSKKIIKRNAFFNIQKTYVRWFEDGFWFKFTQNGELTKKEIGANVLAYDSLNNRSVRIIELTDTSVAIILDNKKEALDYVLNPFFYVDFVGILSNVAYFSSNANLYYYDFQEEKIFKIDSGFFIDIVFCDKILFGKNNLFSMRKKTKERNSKAITVYELAHNMDQYFIDFQNKKLYILHIDGTADSIDVECED